MWIGLFVGSVDSLGELQSTGPICLVSSCYSCCSLRLLPISKRVSVNCYSGVGHIVGLDLGTSFGVSRSFVISTCMIHRSGSYITTLSCCRITGPCYPATDNSVVSSFILER
jgi:hypothetical protein